MNEENVVHNAMDLRKVWRQPTESEGLDKLFQALSKAQQEMEMAKTEARNPFFKSKYADLASVVKASRPYLCANGLCVVQRILPNAKGEMSLFTRLCHSSGQWMESSMAILPPKNDIQTIGSYITYLRRYNYASVVGVVAAEEDDDGENAMAPARRQTPAGSPPPSSNITKAQVQVISSELENHEDILEGLLKAFKISKLSDLPEKHYTQCVNRIRDIKRAKEEK
jgi:hypothetical protein